MKFARPLDGLITWILVNDGPLVLAAGWETVCIFAYCNGKSPLNC